MPKHRQTAVRRNKLKRQLREIMRTDLLPRLKASDIAVDIMVRARREAYDSSFDVLREELLAWAEKRWAPRSSWS